ncbi:hypothetical protein [Paraburkholderia sp. XV]|uniref:hypothetical protein n=1 Tax=Paraburkholderia sp. XV TaxID=2831520 RepID=UPI001CD4BB22|nr:hypothetical protein [Paraburkholderia sp. XV]
MTRVAYSHFCDDVRPELGNKLSVMGIYSGELFVPVAPFVLSKLCCVLGCMTPTEKPFTSLGFSLTVDGNVIAYGEIPKEQLEMTLQNVKIRAEGPDPVTRYSSSMTLVLSPYLIANAHVIKAHAIVDGEQLPAGRLYITPQTVQSAVPPQT